MSATPIKLVHLAPHVRGFGGIELLLERHVALDARLGFDARQLGLFGKRAADTTGDWQTLGFGWRDTPVAMRRAIAPVLASGAGSVILWHNAWGLPWFADIDGSDRRVVFLHADRRYFEAWLTALRGSIDGVLTVSPAAAVAAAELLPGFPSDRIAALPLAIEPPAGATLARQKSDPVRLGYAGRLVREQKRLDRLVPFVAALDRLGVRFQLEIIGGGPLRPWLERQFNGDARVEFTGVLDKAEYWRRLQQWDAVVFFSDVEGGPLVLVEAMAMGALPIFPAIGGSLGDAYAPRVDPRCLYPAGDIDAAARVARDLFALPEAELTSRRTKACKLVDAHRPGAYEHAFGEFVRRVAVEPRLSEPPRADRRRRWTDVLPLGMITRFFPQALWR